MVAHQQIDNMAIERQRLPACPICWADRHKCDRDPTTLQCRDCKPYISQGQHQLGLNNAAFDPFLGAASLHADLYKDAAVGSLPALDIIPGSLNQNILGMQVISSAGDRSEHYMHPLLDSLNAGNRQLRIWVNEIVRKHFALIMYGKGPYPEVIDDAVLVGGYINFLCSIIHVTEETKTTRDGDHTANEMEHYNLHIHFQDLILGMLRDLLKETLDAIDFEDIDNGYPEYTRSAYAAALVLRYDADCFGRSLRYGSLRDSAQLPASWKGPDGIFVHWLDRLESVVRQRLRQQCGRHVDWASSLSAKKKARRKSDTFRLRLTLHQIQHTIPEAPPTRKIFTPFGDGDVCLTSPPRSPIPRALGLSEDILVMEDEIPAHVSYLALLDCTEAETSEMDLDLFPGSPFATLAG